MFDIEVQEEKRKKKQELQEKYLNLNKQRQKKTTDATKQTDWKQKYEEEKKKRKALQKEVQKQKKNEQKKTQQSQEAKRDYQLQKHTSQQWQKKYHQEKQEKNNLKHQLEQVEKEKWKLQKSYNALHIRCEILEANQKQSITETLKKQNTYYRIINEDLKKQNRNLQQRLKINNTIKKQEEQDRFKQEIVSLREHNRSLNEKIKSYQDVHQPENLLEVLKDLITIDNINIFYDKDKNRLQKLTEKATRLKLEKTMQKFKKPKRFQIQDIKEEETMMGFISKKESTWYFFDTTSQEDGTYEFYEVIGNTSNHKLKEELPVKCYLRDDGTVTIMEVYPNHELPEKMERTLKPKEKEEKKEKKEYPYFGDGKVLIIGSRNLAEYKQRLSKHGWKVEVHNPFEENYHRIEGKVQQADVVIICTKHISHATMDHIDKKQPKIELIERDNEEWLVARVRFAMNRLQNSTIAETI